MLWCLQLLQPGKCRLGFPEQNRGPHSTTQFEWQPPNGTTIQYSDWLCDLGQVIYSLGLRLSYYEKWG